MASLLRRLWQYIGACRPLGGPVGMGGVVGGQAGRARLLAVAAVTPGPRLGAVRPDVVTLARAPVLIRDEDGELLAT
jgi:hypothetical protein